MSYSINEPTEKWFQFMEVDCLAVPFKFTKQEMSSRVPQSVNSILV